MSEGSKIGIMFFIVVMLSFFVTEITTPEPPDPFEGRRSHVQQAWVIAAPSVVRIDVKMSYGKPEYRWEREWQGSGIIIDKSGHILTNWHVVDDLDTPAGRSYKITFFNGLQVQAEFIRSNVNVDLGLIKIIEQVKDLRPISLANRPLIGETVIVLGTPFGLTNSVSVGIVSGIDREIKIRMGRYISEVDRLLISRNLTTFKHMIQTDAMVCPGNSGGALVNIHGQLLGVINSGSQGGPAFAVPLSVVREFLK